jgi:hypothetical protein
MRLMDGREGRARSRTLVRLYPSAWRARYGAEMLGLLDERPPTWRDSIDIIRGALDAHLHPPTRSRLPAFAAIMAGAAWTVVALAVWPSRSCRTGRGSADARPAPPGGRRPVASIGPALRLGDAGHVRPGRGGSRDRHARCLVALLMAIRGRIRRSPATGTRRPSRDLVGARSRPADGPYGEALVVIGGALLLPPPLAWVVVAIAWTGIGLRIAAERAVPEGLT